MSEPKTGFASVAKKTLGSLWLGLVWLFSSVFNPLLIRELRTRLRSWWSLVLITGYMSILGVVAIGYLLHEAAPGSDPKVLGTQMFQAIAAVEFVLIAFTTVAITAGVISGERQAQTWDLLLMTRRSSFGILWGKLFSALVFVVMLIFAALPIYSIAFLFGGINQRDVVRVSVLIVGTSIFIGTVSILISALSRRVTESMMVSNLLVFAALAVAMLMAYLGKSGSTYGTGAANGPLPALARINPFVAFASGLPSGQGGLYMANLANIHHAFGSGINTQVWKEYLVLAAAVSTFSFLLATFLVRHTPRRLRRPVT